MIARHCVCEHQHTTMAPGNNLAVFGRRRYVSVSALSTVMDEIREHGMPEHSSRRAIKRARDNEFDAETRTPYGVVIRALNIGVDTDGRPLEFWYAEPRSTLYYMMRKCDKLKSFILDVLHRHPCSPDNPWTIIIYNDEVLAGNAMLRHNHTKSACTLLFVPGIWHRCTVF